MKSMDIYLRSIEDVKEFVNITSKIEGDVTLSGGGYIIDAKSIMGIFRLDLTKRIKLDIENWKKEYASLFEKYQKG